MTAVTVPLEFTVAMLALELDHTTVRPVRTAPSASLRTAVAVTLPEPGTLGAERVTLTVETGGMLTMMTLLAETPSIVALMEAAPKETAVTSPELLTVATVLSLLDQMTVRPDRMFPPASLGVALAFAVSPGKMELLLSEIATVLTGMGMTWMSTDALRFPTAPDIVAVPTFSAVRRPLEETVATLGSELLQEIVSPLISSPLAFLTATVSEIDVPTVILVDVGGTMNTFVGTDALDGSFSDDVRSPAHARVTAPRNKAVASRARMENLQ